MADDGSLAKVLFYDIVQQLRLPAGLASVDAANCYDSIGHAIVSLIFQAFGVSKEAVVSMLETIEEMKFFFCTQPSETPPNSQKVPTGSLPGQWSCVSRMGISEHHNYQRAQKEGTWSPNSMPNFKYQCTSGSYFVRG